MKNPRWRVLFSRNHGCQPFNRAIIALLIQRLQRRSPSRLHGRDAAVRPGATVPLGAHRRAPPRAAAGPPAILGPQPCFYGVRAGLPGATVGVLATGVPRSTCWKAQLRPIYINTTSSSSTSTNTRQAQALAEERSARRYETGQTRVSHNPSWSIIILSRTPHNLRHQGITTKRGGDVALSRPSGPQPPEERRV